LRLGSISIGVCTIPSPGRVRLLAGEGRLPAVHLPHAWQAGGEVFILPRPRPPTGGERAGVRVLPLITFRGNRISQATRASSKAFSKPKVVGLVGNPNSQPAEFGQPKKN